MNKRTIEITGEIDLYYDEASPEFQEALSSYREVVDSEGTVTKMLRYVASQLQSYPDHQHMVEGVGYVLLLSDEKIPENYSGIRVNNDYPTYEYD